MIEFDRVWDSLKTTHDYKELKRLAPAMVESSLREMFRQGWNARGVWDAAQHENINTASDQERFDKSPGAGAMGAIIEYRDEIRKQDKDL